MPDKDYFHPQTDFFRKLDLPAPETIPHGTDDNIRQKLQPAKPTSWTLEGNKLIAQTELGEVVNFLPTDYILKGVDAGGKPILEKI